MTRHEVIVPALLFPGESRSVGERDKIQGVFLLYGFETTLVIYRQQSEFPGKI